jgi:hypothetical protein
MLKIDDNLRKNFSNFDRRERKNEKEFYGLDSITDGMWIISK